MRRALICILFSLLVGLCGCQTAPPSSGEPGSSSESTEAGTTTDTPSSTAGSSTAGTVTDATSPAKPLPPLACTTGFRDIAPWDMDFLAVGTGGRMAVVSPSGDQQSVDTMTKNSLHAVAVQNGAAYAVGDAGTLVVYDGQEATNAVLDAGVNLCSIVSWNGRLYAGGSDGALFSFAPDDLSGTRLSTSAAGIVTGLAASDKLLLAVTDRGEILTSGNGRSWSRLDYNQAYQTDAVFGRALWTDGLFYAVGRHADGTPLLIQSSMGGVWAERALDSLNGEPADLAGLSLGGMAWDGQQAYIACSDGQLLTLPDCVQCNQLQTIADANLTAAVYHSGRVAAVGENFCTAVVDTESVRQYHISAETALQKQQQGAHIIDVRDAAEYAERHIRGSLSLPLGELSEQLAKRIPDKSATLIFYCTKGMRSQAAVEQARGQGYESVYSLGAMEGWPYEFAVGADNTH